MSEYAEELKKNIRESEWKFKTAFRIIIPWKKRYDEHEAYDYNEGWNDCLKEIKKRRTKFLKHLELNK